MPGPTFKKGDHIMFKIICAPCDAAETIESIKAEGYFIVSAAWDDSDGTIVYTYYKKGV